MVKFKLSNSKLLAYFAVVFVMFSGYLIMRHKNQMTEVKNLPFYNVSLADVEDGVYIGKTYTSFLHVQLEVTVKNHSFESINIIENKGSQGIKVKPILDEMIAQNKTIVPAIKGEELASVVFISCVDSAIKQGLPLENLE